MARHPHCFFLIIFAAGEGWSRDGALHHLEKSDDHGFRPHQLPAVSEEVEHRGRGNEQPVQGARCEEVPPGSVRTARFAPEGVDGEGA